MPSGWYNSVTMLYMKMTTMRNDYHARSHLGKTALNNTEEVDSNKMETMWNHSYGNIFRFSYGAVFSNCWTCWNIVLWLMIMEKYGHVAHQKRSKMEQWKQRKQLTLSNTWKKIKWSYQVFATAQHFPQPLGPVLLMYRIGNRQGLDAEGDRVSSSAEMTTP